MTLAALPWYDFAELHQQTDAWWAGIARHLRAAGVARAPDRLLRGPALAAHWRDPALLLSQACGYDVLYDHADALQPVATPCYLAEGCEGPRYRSYVVARADRPWRTFAQLRGRRVAVNEASSHSGNNAMRPQAALLQQAGTFFGEVVVTGAHVESLRALHAGEVDVACIDAVVLALLRRVRPSLVTGLRRVAHTCVALAPPYVTSRRTPPELLAKLRHALHAAVRDPALRAARDALLLRDFVCFPQNAYAELEDFEEPAVAVGYLQLPAPARSPLAKNGQREERA